MSSVEIVPFEDRHAPGIARLCTDRAVAVADRPGDRAGGLHGAGLRRRTSPSSTTRSSAGPQALGDGVLQSHLSFVAVHPDHRRRGIARLLTVATFQATHTVRMDLITDAAEPFYEAFEHRRMHGFRIYPGA